MNKILNVTILALVVTIIYGYPQGQDSPYSQLDQSHKSSNTPTGSSPLYSSTTATAGINKQGVPQTYVESRKTRDTSNLGFSKTQDTAHHNTDDHPATVDPTKKQNSGPQKLAEEINSRKTRAADDRHGNDQYHRQQGHQSHQDHYPSRDNHQDHNSHHH